MAEYIEREAAIKAQCYDCGNEGFCSTECDAVTSIRRIPAADVRPVVYCKDCVHFQQFRPHDGFCNIDGMLWNNDFFCAAGEKREER